MIRISINEPKIAATSRLKVEITDEPEKEIEVAP